MTHINSDATEAKPNPKHGHRRRHDKSASTDARPAPRKSIAALKLLARNRGATIIELATLTGWQSHSVRAYLSGLRKKGFALLRETRKTGEGAYRVANAGIADAAPPARKGGTLVDAPGAVDASIATVAAAGS